MCEDNMVVKALAEDTEPHFTTISNFVSGMGGEIEKVFSEVLMVCSEMGLIKGKMFAIDGCRLPSNVSKEWSGTMEELKEKYDKIKNLYEKYGFTKIDERKDYWNNDEKIYRKTIT